MCGRQLASCWRHGPDPTQVDLRVHCRSAPCPTPMRRCRVCFAAIFLAISGLAYPSALVTMCPPHFLATHGLSVWMAHLRLPEKLISCLQVWQRLAEAEVSLWVCA